MTIAWSSCVANVISAPVYRPMTDSGIPAVTEDLVCSRCGWSSSRATCPVDGPLLTHRISRDARYVDWQAFQGFALGQKKMRSAITEMTLGVACRGQELREIVCRAIGAAALINCTYSLLLFLDGICFGEQSGHRAAGPILPNGKSCVAGWGLLPGNPQGVMAATQRGIRRYGDPAAVG